MMLGKGEDLKIQIPIEIIKTYHYWNSNQVEEVVRALSLGLLSFLILFTNGLFVFRWTWWILTELTLFFCILIYHNFTAKILFHHKELFGVCHQQYLMFTYICYGSPQREVNKLRNYQGRQHIVEKCQN